MENEKNIKVIVATHKEYKMPTDSMYLPIHVGAKNKPSLGYTTDDTLDNISEKNYCYCELTGLYWAWKNLSCDYLGLVHYRRYFSEKKGKKSFDNILSSKKLSKLIDENPDTVFVPKKRNYYIETNKSQYVHAHHPEGLTNTEKVIKEFYPEYLEAWNKSLNMRSGHRFNMFIMSKDICDNYCAWLFDILFKVESMTDISSWTKSEQRIYGYIAERLLDVYLMKNNIKTKDLSYMFMEKQNWLKKGAAFIKRKLFKNNK